MGKTVGLLLFETLSFFLFKLFILLFRFISSLLAYLSYLFFIYVLSCLFCCTFFLFTYCYTEHSLKIKYKINIISNNFDFLIFIIFLRNENLYEKDSVYIFEFILFSPFYFCFFIYVLLSPFSCTFSYIDCCILNGL